MKPFQPTPLSTTTLNLADAQQDVTLPARRDTMSIMIDNRGSTDVLIEFDIAPQDSKSFRIAPFCAQVVSAPFKSTKLCSKRPAGSASEIVYVSIGEGA